MNLIGLTGGIGMGKSTAADLLQRRGLPVVDTDLLARQVVEPGQPALLEIQKNFGSGIVTPNGRLQRHELAQIIFSDQSKRRQLEAILHPRIRQLWMAQAEQWRAENKPAGVVVIPLLFETNAQRHFDAIICVACSAATQQQRLLARGWTLQQIQQRLRAQWPIAKKMELSHFVVWTESTSESHSDQLSRILSALHLPANISRRIRADE